MSSAALRNVFATLLWFGYLFVISFAHSNESLIVYTELSPPYQTYDGKRVGGIATERVRALLAHANLKATIEMVPWARAMKKVQESDNTLIFSVGRIPEREDQFHWIAPVARYEMSFVALTKRHDITPERLIDLTSYTFAVQRNDMSYKWLKRKGLTENKQLLVCPDIACSWRYIMAGHVDLMFEDASLIEQTAADFGYDANRLKVLKRVPELAVDAYLVAPKTMHLATVEKLKKAAEKIK
ncbi:substrate-binding periplasmic protein [Alteromonas sediminis]|nr:transporter substrate-binding domain-containing protein [Alteromonas sediminis]